jgi:hypothetical protein
MATERLFERTRPAPVPVKCAACSDTGIIGIPAAVQDYRTWLLSINPCDRCSEGREWKTIQEEELFWMTAKCACGAPATGRAPVVVNGQRAPICDECSRRELGMVRKHQHGMAAR